MPGSAAAMGAIDYRLYLVTDDPGRYEGDWLGQVVAAVEGGVSAVQYRDTVNPRAVQYERLLALRGALARFKTPIIVNNDVELAIAVKAEGVHVGQSDMPVAEVARRLAAAAHPCEIGLSITALEQLERVAGPVERDSTGTTITFIDGRPWIFCGSADRACYVYSYPDLQRQGALKFDFPPWGEKECRNGRVWAAVAELPDGYPFRYLMLTMNRANFPGMPKPNWTYGGLIIYGAN